MSTARFAPEEDRVHAPVHHPVSTASERYSADSQDASITIEPCPVCDTTDSISCPACNARGLVVFVDDLSRR